MDLHLELKDATDEVVWEYDEAYSVEMTEIELQKKSKKKYRIEVPFSMENVVEKLSQGKNKVHILLKNRTGGEELKKVVALTI
jgi:hypothetical protein